MWGIICDIAFSTFSGIIFYSEKEIYDNLIFALIGKPVFINKRYYIYKLVCCFALLEECICTISAIKLCIPCMVREL